MKEITPIRQIFAIVWFVVLAALFVVAIIAPANPAMPPPTPIVEVAIAFTCALAAIGSLLAAVQFVGNN
jgi:hypothetical protein